MGQLVVQCGSCRQRFGAESWLAGKMVACPSCGNQIAVPAAATPGPLNDLLDEELSAASSPLSSPAAGQLPGMGAGKPWPAVPTAALVWGGVAIGILVCGLIAWAAWPFIQESWVFVVVAINVTALLAVPVGFIWLQVLYWQHAAEEDRVVLGLGCLGGPFGVFGFWWLLIKFIGFTLSNWQHTWRPTLMMLFGPVVLLVGIGIQLSRPPGRVPPMQPVVAQSSLPTNPPLNKPAESAPWRPVPTGPTNVPPRGSQPTTNPSPSSAAPDKPWTTIVDPPPPGQPTAPSLWELPGSVRTGTAGQFVAPRTASPWIAMNRSVGNQVRLEVLNIATGKLALSVAVQNPARLCLRADGAYLARVLERTIDVWSVPLGKRVLSLPRDPRAAPFVDFVGQDQLVVFRSREPDRQIELYALLGDGTPEVTIPATPSRQPPSAAAVSPGGRYLAAIGQRLQMWDLTTQELVNDLAAPQGEAAIAPSALCFSPDGRELAALGRRQPPSLMLWSLDRGDPAVWPLSDQTVFGEDGDFRALPDGSGWWTTSGHLIQRKGIFPMKLGAGDQGCRYAPLGFLDAQTLVIAAGSWIGAARFDPNGGGRIADESKVRGRIGINAPLLPPPVESKEGLAVAAVEPNLRYLRNAYADYIAGPPERLVANFGWSTGRKQPIVGVRWGVAVCFPEGNVATVDTEQQLTQLTGPVGRALINGLEGRLNKGLFGFWPDLGDDRARSVTYLGSLEREALLPAAKANGLDALLTIDATQQALGPRRFDKVLRIKLIDASGKTPVWISPSMTGQRAAEKPQGVVEWVNDILTKAEDTYGIAPFPSLTAEAATKRVETLASQPRASDPLPLLIEVRYYEAKGLLPRERALAVYERHFGAEGAKLFSEGTEGQRRRIVDSLLLATNPRPAGT